MKKMTKSGRREIKNDERRAKWKAWNRGEIGLCGTKWFTKKFLVFFIFAWCAMSVSISSRPVVGLVLMLLLHGLSMPVSPSYLLSLSLAYQESHFTALLRWSLLQGASIHQYPRNSHVRQPTFPSPLSPRFRSTRLATSSLSQSTISTLRYGIPPAISRLGRVTLEKQRSLRMDTQSLISRSIFHMSRQMIRILPG